MLDAAELKEKALRALEKPAAFGEDINLADFDRSFVPHHYMAQEECAGCPKRR